MADPIADVIARCESERGDGAYVTIRVTDFRRLLDVCSKASAETQAHERRQEAERAMFLAPIGRKGPTIEAVRDAWAAYHAASLALYAAVRGEE